MEILGNTDTPSVDIQHALKTDTIDEISEGAGVTIDGVLLKDGTLTFMDLYVDHIGEKTANAGVTIDGLVCKDHYLWLTNDTSELRIKGGTHVDASPHIYMLGKDIGYGDPGSIGFATTNIAGDDTELMLTLSGRDVNPLIRAYEKIQADVGIATNTIAERTTGYGVTIDGCLIKNGVAGSGETEKLFVPPGAGFHAHPMFGGAGVAKLGDANNYPTLEFEHTEVQRGSFSFIVPQDYASGGTLKIVYLDHFVFERHAPCAA